MQRHKFASIGNWQFVARSEPLLRPSWFNQLARRAQYAVEVQTTAEEIRALYAAGFDRTQIAKQLGIRYQHVRQALLRSGLTGGLRREVEADREPIEVPAAPAPREDTSWTVLLKAGFEYLGDWTHDPQSALRLDAKAPNEPGVYAFVVNDVVVYVGLTLNGLRARMDQYRRGHKGQRTSSRINGLIAQSLQAGDTVKVLVATPEPIDWRDLPVNTAAGLEAGLIEMIRPAWNMRGA